ncbi:MAG: tetratricopeptide repeat protein [Promethearchaeota archaeon]|jgi:tetratricopeptide (TPR) repeat protein
MQKGYKISNSVLHELVFVKELINKGKFEEALQHVKDIEKKKPLTNEEILKTQKYKGLIYNELGNSIKTLVIAKKLYKKSQEMKMPLLSIGALNLKGRAFLRLARFEDFYENLEQQERLFKTILREDSLEFQEIEADILYAKGIKCFYKGRFNIALDYLNTSLKLLEKIDFHSLYIPGIIVLMAYCYQIKGELNLALDCDERALSLIPKGTYYSLLTFKADIYRNMGSIFYQKGDFDKALEYHTYSLDIYKRIKEGLMSSWAYYNIILVLLAKEELNQTENYLQEFKQFKEKHGFELTSLIYTLSHALILKSGPRLRDHVKAETMLKEIAEGNYTHFVKKAALVSLCEWYFEEFQISNQVEVLDDIHQIVNQLITIAQDQNSYSLLSNVKLLQAKLALIQTSFEEGKQFLTEAQKVAEEHGLTLLAQKISNEHDILLDKVDEWEKLKKEDAPMADRIELASFDGVLTRLQGKKAVDPPELVDEEPILLLIMDNSGATYFNHPFVAKWDYSDLFSSFMSAFNTFMDEIFSNSIDRIKVKENTILIRPVENFLVCYVIKGQSYPALQKLTRFTEAIRKNSEIWQALNKSVKTSEMLGLENPPVLKTLINEIFT